MAERPTSEVRPASRVANKRFILLGVIVAAFAAAALLIDIPTPHEFREWAEQWGTLGPVVFFVAYTVITIAPIPRTVFTLSAGLLFAPVLGIALAVGATTVSALLAFLMVRYLGRDWVIAHLPEHKTISAIDHHLERRGWLAVASMRLIAPLPFSVVNYTCGLSGVHGVQYMLATFVGVLPGTVAVVVLGDSLIEGVTAQMLIASLVFAVIGVMGLLIDAKVPVDEDEPEPVT